MCGWQLEGILTDIAARGGCGGIKCLEEHALEPLVSSHCSREGQSQQQFDGASSSGIEAAMFASAANSDLHASILERFVEGSSGDLNDAGVRLRLYSEWKRQLAAHRMEHGPMPRLKGVRYGWHGHTRGLYPMPLFFIQLDQELPGVRQIPVVLEHSHRRVFTLCAGF